VRATERQPALFDVGPDGFEPEGHRFLETDIERFVIGESVALLSKPGKTPPGQILIGCLEGALYLLAENRKPSEISAVTVSEEAFADFLKSQGLAREPQPASRLAKPACDFGKNGLVETDVSRLI
jgi:hypothetical protein